MKKRVICLVIAISILSVLAFGCAKDSPDTVTKPEPDKATEKEDVKEPEVSEEPLEMTIRMFYHGEIDATMAKNGIDFNDNKIANFHREHSGVNVTFEPALADGEQESQKKAMILASNETPDLMDMNRNDYFRYAMQGVLEDTEPYLADMPDYVSLAGQEVLDAVRYKGTMYSFPSVLEEKDLNRTHAGGICVRKDIMTELNIEEPETIEDVYQLWKTVKENTDLIPLATAGDNFAAIKAAFRVALDYKEVGDELEYIWIQPEYKDYLTFMNRLYSEKLLDNEYITVDGTTLTEKFMANKAFSTCTGWVFPVVTVRDIDQKVDGAQMGYLKQPTDGDGNKALLNHGWPVQRMWVVPAAAKNKEAAAKFMNYMSTKESKMVQDYGIEGEDYTLDGEGNPEYTEEQQMEVTWRICYEVMATPDSFKVRLVGKGYDWSYNEALEAQKTADITTNILEMLPPSDEFQKLEQKLSLRTFIDEETTKFIIGDRSLDEFDKFVEEIKEKGLDEQTIGLNKWYLDNK